MALHMLLRVVLTLTICFHFSSGKETVSKVDEDKFSIAKERRYLLHNVNPGEGFNLRRDVYMRVANVVRQLRDKGENFVLVLPPWGGCYHWQTRHLGDQTRIPWSLFFDVVSLNKFVPVIEFEQFLQETGSSSIDLIYYLQRYKEGWKNGQWEEKWHERPCIEADRHYFQNPGDRSRWYGWFWGYGDDQVSAKQLTCISIQGQSSTLLPLIRQPQNEHITSILIDRAETILHDFFGDVYYWQTRRSMRYSKTLVHIANEYRRTQLNSTDESDRTVVDEDWTLMKKKHGEAKGAPYLAVHLRRKDFLRAHADELPSLEGAAKQIVAALDKLKLDTVFIATDAPYDEVQKLLSLLPSTVTAKKYEPGQQILSQYKDGGVSIIDQLICAHARYFIGSYVSTFSFRIHDEREILGFDPVTTFNRFCPDGQTDCEQPAKWKIVYE